MNSAKFWVIAACALLLGSCATRSAEIHSAQNSRRLAESSLDEQVALGIERQCTIYPAHFVPGTAELSGLGVRDLTVLADFFGRHPGELSIWRAQAPQALYESRVRAVRSFLESRGVQVARMNFTEAWPGGDGLGAESVILRYLAAEASVGLVKVPAGEVPGGAGGNGAPGGGQ